MKPNTKLSSKNILELYTKSLIKALNMRLEEYYKRSDNNPIREHTHIQTLDALKDAANSGITAASVGTQVFPVVGTAVFAAGGAAYSLFSSVVKEAKCRQNNNKIDNADKILQFFNYYKMNDVHHIDQKLLEDAAKLIINQRSMMLLRLIPSEETIEIVGDYLAVNILSAVKQNDFKQSNNKVEWMSDGVQMLLSKKISSINLKTIEERDLSLKEIAENAVTLKDYEGTITMSRS